MWVSRLFKQIFDSIIIEKFRQAKKENTMTIKYKTAPFNFLNLYQNSEDFKKSRFLPNAQYRILYLPCECKTVGCTLSLDTH